ncbi:hypothetical protein ES703_66454 [subsurface metagenome]
MTVHTTISLCKDVKDLDKADDWFAEVKELLQGKVTCSMFCQSLNPEPLILLTEDPPDG